MRIGARDVLGFAELDTVGRELSSLADACVEAALRSLEPSVPFAVIGMGRLGGAELSYASDIDVIFVYDGTTATDFDSRRTHRDPARRARSATARRRAGRSASTPACAPKASRGRWRDRSAATAAYYEQWGQTWEFQALTKARVVAGDAERRAPVPASSRSRSCTATRSPKSGAARSAA